MKRMTTLCKRGLALFLVLTMCISLLQTTALAAGLDIPAADGRVLACGLTEHTHADECYAVVETRTLTCTLKTAAGHTHDASCYAAGDPALTCASEEEGHEHTDACFTPGEQVLTCGQEETAGHTHGDACYAVTRNRGELTCSLGEHTHTDVCYQSAAPVCVCETKCGSLPNALCPVCGAEGADLALCKGLEPQVPALVQVFLDAVAALEMADPADAEAYTALGQAAMDAYENVQNAGLENWAGVSEALAKLMALAERQTGGVGTLADSGVIVVTCQKNWFLPSILLCIIFRPTRHSSMRSGIRWCARARRGSDAPSFCVPNRKCLSKKLAHLLS